MTERAAGRATDWLLVEDSPADAELMRTVLQATEFEGTLHVASDGEDALDFLRGHGPRAGAPRPSLVLLDLNLPLLDGPGVLAEIRGDEQLAAIPVVVMSSSDARGDVERGYALGSNAYICKPVDLDDYYRMVHAIVEFWFANAKLP